MPTVKELKQTLRAHNKAHCVKLSGRKSELVQRVTRLGGEGSSHRPARPGGSARLRRAGEP